MKLRYFVSKTLGFLATLILVSLVTFAVFQILPGDPAALALGPDAEQSKIDALRLEMGLDKPAVTRYLNWLGGLLTGDPGTSIRFRLPVMGLILARLPVTLSLTVITLSLTALISLPISVAVSKNRNGFVSHAVSALSQLGLAIPTFWLAMMLALLFSVYLKILPAVDYTPLGNGFFPWLRSLLLPAMSLAVGNSAYVMRFLRNSLADELGKDYVRTARSKGMKSGEILRGVVLRNAMIPVITVFGMLVVDTLGGSIIIESVFNLPGLGSLVTYAIGSRDYVLIQGLVLYIAGVVVLLNYLVDLLYKLIDPRIKVS